MRKFLLHLGFWLVFYFMWNRMVYFYVDNVYNELYFSALDVSLIIGAFYTVYLYVMPDYFRRKSISRLTLLSGLVVVAFTLLYAWLMLVFLRHMLMPIHFEFSWNYTDLQYNRFFMALIGVLGACFVKLAIDRFRMRQKIDAMEKEKSQAELDFLKAQINPHFLFNSLNSLYSQMEFDTGAARGTLLSLADLLRYQLYECNAEFIPVSGELAYLENYFALQRIRSDNCHAVLTITGEYATLAIAPLLLMPFVENAFKHISDDDSRDNFIRAALTFSGNELHFNCVNTLAENNRNVTVHPAGGIGLNNVKKRLELIYGNGFRLKNNVKEGCYHVNLWLKLTLY